MGTRYVLIPLLASGALLGGCAAAPRAPAGTLAAAGIAATTGFGAEVNGMAKQLEYVGVTEAFTRTWEACANPSLPCDPQLEPPGLTTKRSALAGLVAMRADAIAALGQAYAALQAEASHDGGADLQSAAGAAVDSVNSFAQRAAELTGKPLPDLIPGPIAGLIGFGAELVGERRQRHRLLAASASIGAATRRLRDGLERERSLFNDITSYLVQKRSGARIALYDAGLIPPVSVLTPLAKNLDADIVDDPGAVIAASPRLQTALKATLEGMSRAEVVELEDRYRISLAALNALIESHEALETKRPMSVGDVERFLDELDASLAPRSGGGSSAGPAPAPAGPSGNRP